MPTAAAQAAPPTADPAAPSPEVAALAPAVQQQADAAAEQAAEQEAELREQAVETLTACRKAYCRGEQAYRAGLLEAGRLADVFVHQKLALGDKRAAATDLLTLELSKYASSTVDPNALIACYHAHRLLAVEQGLAGSGKKPGLADSVLPYGVLREHWARVVERQAKDTPLEHWTLLPGLEQECQDAFRKAVNDSLSRDAVKDLVRGLVVEYAKRQAQAKQQEAQAAAGRAQAEKLALEQQAAGLRAAREAHDRAQQAAKEQASEQTTAALAEAADKLREAQKATIEAQDRAEQAERARLAAEKRQAEEKARLDRESRKAEEKARKTQQPATVAPPQQPAQQPPTPADKRGEGTITGNILRLAEAGTVKDVAEMVVELMTGTGKAESVLEEVLRQLKAGGHVHKRAVGAIDAALLVLSRKEAPRPAGPSPVELATATANVNGHVAAVA